MYQNNFVFFKYIRNVNLYIDTYISIMELVESIWNVKKKQTDRSLTKIFWFKKNIILIVLNYFNNRMYLNPIQSSASWIPGLSMAFTMILSVLAISFLMAEAKVSPDGSLVWPDLGQLYALDDLRNGLGNGYYDLESRSSPNQDWSNAGYQEPTLNDDIFSEASIRDQEYQENSPLWGYQSVSGGSDIIVSFETVSENRMTACSVGAHTIVQWNPFLSIGYSIYCIPLRNTEIDQSRHKVTEDMTEKTKMSFLLLSFVFTIILSYKIRELKQYFMQTVICLKNLFSYVR